MHLRQFVHSLLDRVPQKGMLSAVGKVTIVAASLLFLAMTATPANNAEELVFSTSGSFMTLTDNSRGIASTPFGFWIWCAFHASPSSTPVTYQGAQVCQGSMYFYALGIPEHVVSAFLTKESPEGVYHLTVFGFKSPEQSLPDFSCFLRNETLQSGPTNTVHVDCTFFNPELGGGTGSADVTNAVVKDTGP
jgi:hypothetical protein